MPWNSSQNSFITFSSVGFARNFNRNNFIDYSRDFSRNLYRFIRFLKKTLQRFQRKSCRDSLKHHPKIATGIALEIPSQFFLMIPLENLQWNFTKFALLILLAIHTRFFFWKIFQIFLQKLVQKVLLKILQWFFEKFLQRFLRKLFQGFLLIYLQDFWINLSKEALLRFLQ